MRIITKTEGVFKHNNLPLGIEQIYRNFSVPVEIPHYDYTVIGLRAEEPIRVAGGIKTENDYSGLFTLSDQSTERRIFVCKHFNYIYQSLDPAEVGVWIEHVFLNEDGVGEGISKIEFKPLNIGEIAAVRRGQRQYAISRLDSIGLIMPELQGDLEILRQHYSLEIDLFEKYGSNDFQDAILNETDQTIINILDTVVTYEGVDFTVRNAILEQTNPHYQV